MVTRMHIRHLLFLAFSVGIAAPTFARQETAPGVAEVRACMARASPQESVESDLVLETHAEGDAIQRLELKLYGKRDQHGRMRVLLRIEDPPDLRGYTLLVRERPEGDPEIFTYLPELRTVRRITGRALSGSLFGTDLIYEDLLELLEFSRAGKVERRADEVLDGRPVYVLVAIPPQAVRSAYVQITTLVDREVCILRRASFYDRPDHLAKELLVPWDTIITEGAFRIPQLVIVKNIAKGSETRLRTIHTLYDAGLRDSLFTTAELAQGR